MIDIKTFGTFGIECALYGMRLPMNSNNMSDSHTWLDEKYIIVGEKDKTLSNKLFKSGPDHSKHLDHMFVQCSITAPRYWLAELMTYTTLPSRPVSGSTMHTLTKRPLTLEDFSIESLDEETKDAFQKHIDVINEAIARKDLLTAKVLLPESFNQERIFTFNYTNLANIYRQRKNHRLSEWKYFCKWIEGLSYSELIIGDKDA